MQKNSSGLKVAYVITQVEVYVITHVEQKEPQHHRPWQPKSLLKTSETWWH